MESRGLAHSPEAVNVKPKNTKNSSLNLIVSAETIIRRNDVKNLTEDASANKTICGITLERLRSYRINDSASVCEENLFFLGK